MKKQESKLLNSNKGEGKALCHVHICTGAERRETFRGTDWPSGKKKSWAKGFLLICLYLLQTQIL